MVCVCGVTRLFLTVIYSLCHSFSVVCSLEGWDTVCVGRVGPIKGWAPRVLPLVFLCDSV